MNTKLYLISILAALSSFGILFIQIDWMNKMYDTEFRKLNREADSALTGALYNYHEEQKDSIAKILIPQLAPLYDSVMILHAPNYDSLFIKLRNVEQPVYKNGISNIDLSVQIGRITLSVPAPEDQDQHLQDSYKKADAVIRAQIAQSDHPCDPLYFKSDSSTIARYVMTSLEEMNLGDMKNLAQLVFFCGSTPPVPSFSLGSFVKEYRPNGLNTYVGNKRWVGLYFQNHKNKILSRMMVPALSSLVLILISIASFIYLFIIVLRQKRLAEMKDDFINNMTHELKTPIAIISAAVEGMQKFNVLNDQEKTTRYLETSHQELKRLDNLVTKVLHMASYEKRDIELYIDNIELSSFIDNIIDSFSIHPDKSISINFHNHTSINYFYADRVHFRNVLANLIDNAIKYSNDAVTITIDCVLKDNFINFSVNDNGIGIPVSQVDHIFEKFHRVPTGNLHQVKGTGLGLSYVKYIMRLHGGNVSVKSEVNKGSQFVVSLPYKG